jgi:putative effector of murein hydrolase LrgA (UPF0299 family)
MLLGHLSLLFVPVGVGVTHLDALAATAWRWWRWLVSTWVGLTSPRWCCGRCSAAMKLR